MMMDWLSEIPVMVWIGLAVVLVGILIITIIINSKRSREVDELQKAFGDPYDYPEEEEERLQPKSKQKNKDRGSGLSFKEASSQKKESRARQPSEETPSEEMSALNDRQWEEAIPEKNEGSFEQQWEKSSSKEKVAEPEWEIKERKTNEEPESTVDQVHEISMGGEEEAREIPSTPESKKETDAGIEQKAESIRKRLTRRNVASPKQEQSDLNLEEKEKWEKVDRDWAALASEPLPSRGSRHGKSKRAASGKKPGRTSRA